MRIAADIQIHKRPVGFVARRWIDNKHIRAFRGENVISTLDKYITSWEGEGLSIEFTPLAQEKYDAIINGVIEPQLHKP